MLSILLSKINFEIEIQYLYVMAELFMHTCPFHMLISDVYDVVVALFLL